ncbi:DUF4179 domain-containing protein [Paenibacillus xylanexedens]|uniref:DUF4179 domain-containing protein n=1 Tax=Paenibacillus xylanexedens TaxID=528191 RepID=UPI0011A3952F|nr:DUF4179 domain-containing protein [Paenibacillus xylanexedens]
MVKITENQLSHHLKNDKDISYPDFDAMWNQISQDQERCPALHVSGTREYAGRRIQFKKTVLIGTAAVVLLATPVYAAVHYNWDDLLDGRSGIQHALQMELGQQLNQSMTLDGVTLTLDTAFTDDNRTVILYTLDPGKYTGDNIEFSSIGLQGEDGKLIEGRYHHVYDSDESKFKGYFETEWTPKGKLADVHFIVGGIQMLVPAEAPLTIDTLQKDVQTFNIDKDGLGTLEVSAFNDKQNQVMLSTSLTFEQPEVRDYAFPQVIIYDHDGNVIKESTGGVFGTPGDHGEYTAEQYYSLETLKESAASYVLAYNRQESQVDQAFNIDIQLDKTEMLSGTSTRALNLPMEGLPEGAQIKEAIITPTQIRVIISHQEKYMPLSYVNYTLDVEGATLYGGLMNSGLEYETELRFEVTPGMEVNQDTPITLIASHKINQFHGEFEPVTLTQISEKPQQLDTVLGGYVVHWTYYRKDGDLYVERYSDDLRFGGVNQTYMIENGKRNYGKRSKAQFSGDGDNKGIDQYKQYTSDTATVYPWAYSTEEPERKVSVQLQERTK